MTSHSDDEFVVLELTDPSSVEGKLKQEVISISVSEIEAWDLPLIVQSRTVRVQANRSRLIHQSSYFHGLLGGNFSESSLNYVSIQWNIETSINVLQFTHGSSLSITSSNFIPLLEGALFFGVEKLLLECETWFSKITSKRVLSSQQISLGTIIEIWNFGLEHGIGFVAEPCKGYLARNFAWAVSCSLFADIPYSLLHSSLDDPQLTVDSEKQLCEAFLIWLSNNAKCSECLPIISRNNKFDILKKVRICLLPLEFAAGLRRHFSQFADGIVNTILDMIKDCYSSLLRSITDDKIDNFRIRLTGYSERIILSGCAHITEAFLFLAVLPSNLDAALRKTVLSAFTGLDRHTADHYRNLMKSIKMLSFEAVHEIDISKCSRVHSAAAVIWLHLALPSLRTLKASHCLQIKLEDLYCLIQKCPLIAEVDLTVDVSSVIPTKVSVLSASAERYQPSDRTPYKMLEEILLSNIEKLTLTNSILSNISKLTLEGRNDLNDLDLLKLSALSDSLSYLNIKGCTLVTDAGISKLLCKCFKILSLILSYTSFGRNSILTLCSGHIYGFPEIHHNHKYSNTMAFRLQQLDISGCTGVDQISMLQLMSHTYMLKLLSLRETSLIDDVLYNFMGSSLESIDVSETMVSMQALTSVVRQNPGVRILKATGCRNLHQPNCDGLMLTGGASFEDLLHELSKSCIMEELAFGWGFSCLTMKELEPAMRKLRGITLGIGASPGHYVLCALPKMCPLLESVILIFQVISDSILRSILESLKHLQVLGLRCCLGELTSFSFRTSMPMLRSLRLEWVTPWMTNNDLAILTENCSNIVELSLSGCKLLDSDSQEIISSGWPGLTYIHLEDCGKITSNGVSFLFNCKAVEDLLLRHNGRGIGRNFICDAALELPVLRKVALDLCDACEGGFDSPSHAERYSLSTVKISRCKSQRCGFELQTVETFKAVHKETIVLEWNSKELRTTMVKERI
ncbi:BTB/POZ domain-containing protein FBL11 isoform X2 [Phoenix dactylifera]|uniref:BTB/POZ domain-containing protein FBL11 isoform X2 n=1 Tax=Phoenix dactylifera TaxID=42345 RepID=A0A8B7BZB0_PHODC|nr:BTB/POZ domain-containing protein FBL11 isoform X2 [Phoenix dactylifera]